jgi:hypothetical protein
MGLRISPQIQRASPVVRFSFRMAWIRRIFYILYSLEVGIFLLMLPWMTFWDNNFLVFYYPRIRPVVGNPFIKGAVLGLGIVNIMIGIHEISLLRKNVRSQVFK